MSAITTSNRADPPASERGGWEGSDVTDSEVKWLKDTHRIPAELLYRLHTGGDEPNPHPDEKVVFMAHFERGFGLPASTFFREFLKFYGLQPHHLPANSILQLSCYTAFSEGYLGLWPTVQGWAKYFQLKKQSLPNKDVADKEMTACGAASISPRLTSEFPRIKGLQSCKKWQRTFFYVQNPGEEDLINLPNFQLEPPTAQRNWDFDPKNAYAEVQEIHKYMLKLKKKGWDSDDILRTFIERRVSPLQERCHKICHMEGPLDPTRISSVELSKASVWRRVKAIAQTEMGEDWEWGVKPHDRDHLPEQVSTQ
jgi:hypothetical protein